MTLKMQQAEAYHPIIIRVSDTQIVLAPKTPGGFNPIVIAQKITRFHGTDHEHTAWYAKKSDGISGVYCVRLEDGMVFVLSREEYPD